MGAESRSFHRHQVKRNNLSFSLAPSMPVLCRAEPRGDQTLPLPELQTPIPMCPLSISTHMSNSRLFMPIHTWIITPLPSSPLPSHVTSALSLQQLRLVPRSHLDPPSLTPRSKLPENSPDSTFQKYSESTYLSPSPLLPSWSVPPSSLTCSVALASSLVPCICPCLPRVCPSHSSHRDLLSPCPPATPKYAQVTGVK